MVESAEAGKTLAALVRARLGVSWSQAKRHVESGKVLVADHRVTDVSYRLSAGQTVALNMRARRPAPKGPAVRIVYDDRHVVVIDKPVGVSSVPYDKRETDTAMDLLRAAWRRADRSATRVPLHVVHRIDKATSGLLAFAKSKRAERGIAAQLRAHTVQRTYLCVAHGTVRSQRIESLLVRDRGDGLRGTTRHPKRVNQGKRAVTHVRIVETLGRATLCEVRLETGRTHQIRIHLAELGRGSGYPGHPIVGERVYIRDYLEADGELIDSPRLLLHAATLGFEHPVTGQLVELESPLPDDFTAVLGRLR